MKYITRYKKENFERIWIKKGVAEKLREWSKSRGLTLSEAIDELLKMNNIGAQYSATDIDVQLVDHVSDNEVRDLVAEELLKYAMMKLGHSPNEKLLAYIGGDWYIKDAIIALLCRSGAKILVEVFGGSGVISMYAPRTDFKNIIYNDKDELLYSFFKVLREKPKELMRLLILMPASRKLNNELADMVKSGIYKKLSDVEKAAILFYLIRTKFDGHVGAGFKIRKTGSLQAELVRKILSIADVAKKWIDVVIENKDFREIIPLYDSENTVFYCDPPYIAINRSDSDYYRLSFTHADMLQLLNMLSKIKGKFVLKLSEEHLQFSYIKSFTERYNVRVVEHYKHSHKSVAENRPLQKTLLIYNYRA
jgi:DNA adenine methylase